MYLFLKINEMLFEIFLADESKKKAPPISALF